MPAPYLVGFDMLTWEAEGKYDLYLGGTWRRQRRWARRWVTALEAISLAASLLLMVLPIGAVRGPVPVLVNILMPAAVIWLLWTRSGRTAFRKPGPSDARGAA